MSDNIRIRTTPGDGIKSVNININQKFDFIEILSLKISQDEAYRSFCSDYGAVVGRVIVNNGVGVPNAKVSIFIPIDDNDAIDPEILGLYPFEVVTGKDYNGIGYNLLPRNARGKGDCFTPIGTFPSKREIQDNPEVSYIYCKYYKYSTTTNNSGDFMLFGVPVGPNFLHCDVDLSDIGILSQKPYELINDGASENSFASPTEFRSRDETVNLNQLKTISPISVDVVPFWGDKEQCQVGISRVDVDLKTQIISTAIFMGSIFSDTENASINKRCRPKKAMGNQAKLVAGPGTIEMIRKSSTGQISRYDINGGQNIDDDGTWSYLVPMNLDYKVTSEDGTMIPSDDPTIGIATRANVRFRISMGSNGAEGKLRSRAKYLVPNNPEHQNDVDYNFDGSTKPESFVDFYWNKIYTVKNYIARVQPNKSVENRNFIGIKDVDEGANSPFPFNRMDNSVNPIIGVLCLMFSIFSMIICAINSVLINILNLVLLILNVVLGIICVVLAAISVLVCGLAHLFSEAKRKSCRCRLCLGQPCTNGDCFGACLDGILPYIPYISVSCPGDPDGMNYAPCGFKLPGSWQATEDLSQQNNGTSFHYPFDGHPGHDNPTAGWIDCMMLGLMEAWNAFKFDFYNDWVNGTLYSFLFKVKKRKKGKGKMRFCDTDCEDNILGVDNNEDGQADTTCRKNYVLDSCTKVQPDSYTDSSGDKKGVNTKTYYQLREGYIKLYKGEFYYSAISKKTGVRLFATDIVNLGSMVDCDWQGIPKFQQYLIDTTHNKPPLLAEYDGDVVPTDPANIDVTGYDTKLPGGTGDDKLIGNVWCIIMHASMGTTPQTCINVRRFSELGVGLDENRSEDIPGDYVDNKITNNDVDNAFVRGAFLNANTPTSTSIPLVYFDGMTPPANYPTNNFGYDDEINYSEFRDRKIVKNLKEHENSFYFYFGLKPGKTALTKMNNQYFTECIPFDDRDFFITGTIDTPDNEDPLGQGQLTIEMINGKPPFQIEWVGPTISGTLYTNSQSGYNSITQTLSNLYVGSYNVTVVDDLGNTAQGVFYVPGPEPTTCNIQPTPASANGVSDGTISVNISGGQIPFTINIYESDPAIPGGFVTTPTDTASITSTSHVFSNLPGDNYYVEVIDSGTPITECSNDVEITEPNALIVSISGSSSPCYGENAGTATSSVNGGTTPYTVEWTDSNNNNVSSNFTASNLGPGTYTASVTDSSNQTGGGTWVVTEPGDLTFTTGSDDVTCFNQNDGIIGIGSVFSDNTVEITVEGGGTNTYQVNSPGTGSDHLFYNLIADTYQIKLRDIITECEKITSLVINEPTSELTVSIIETVNSLTATIVGGWGNEPGGEYITEWQVSNTQYGSYSAPNLNMLDPSVSASIAGEDVPPYSNKVNLSPTAYVPVVFPKWWRLKVTAKNQTHETNEGCTKYSSPVELVGAYVP